MGNSPAKRLLGNKEVKILIMGLMQSGKTTTLYTLKLGEVVTTIPTTGDNDETLQFKDIPMRALDFGGRNMRHPFYSLYYYNSNGLVYVVDSSDKNRLDEALQELFLLVKGPPADVPILVLANKQDLPDAMKPEDIAVKLHGEQCMSRKRWSVFGVCAVHEKNNGLFEAFDWLVNEMTAAEKHKMACNLVYGAATKDDIDKYYAEKKEEGKKSFLFKGLWNRIKKIMM